MQEGMYSVGRSSQTWATTGVLRSASDIPQDVQALTSWTRRIRSGVGQGGRQAKGIEKHTGREAPQQPGTAELLRKSIRQPEFLRFLDRAGRAQGSFSGL